MQSPTLERFQTVSEAQSGVLHYCASSSGSNTAFTCNISPPISAYSTGMLVHWRPDVGVSGGPTTLQIGGLPAIPIKSEDGVSHLDANQVKVGELHLLWFDGSSFRMTANIPRGMVSRSDLQSGIVLLCPSVSVGGAFTCSISFVLPLHQVGEVLHWIPDADALGGTGSLAVNTRPSVAIKRPDGAQDPVVGDFRAGEMR